MMGLFTRRAFVGALSCGSALAAAARGEIVQYTDPVTENPVYRLTNPATASQLPRASNRFLFGRFLLFSSDRTGKFAPYRLDLHNGELHQIAEPNRLDPISLCLDDSERTLFLIDDGLLTALSLSGKRPRTIAENVSSFSLGRGAGGPVYVQGASLKNPDGKVIASGVDRCCAISPDGSNVLFTRGTTDAARELWCTSLAGTSEPRCLAHAVIAEPFWCPSGQEVFFLQQSDRNGVARSELRQVAVSNAADALISDTSQFAAFAPNRDCSVFVGASRSKAQPDVVLLLRSLRRELILCEHHAHEARSVSPVFSPDSRRIYFQSDREGKPALYSVHVEALVEPT